MNSYTGNLSSRPINNGQWLENGNGIYYVNSSDYESEVVVRILILFLEKNSALFFQPYNKLKYNFSEVFL